MYLKNPKREQSKISWRKIQYNGFFLFLGFPYLMSVFHSIKTSGLHFWKFPEVTGAAFSEI